MKACNLLLKFFIIFISLGIVSYVNAGDFSYSDKPLFYSSGVKPNVALLIDDSGSMQRDGSYDAGGIPAGDTDAWPTTNLCDGSSYTGPGWGDSGASVNKELSRMMAARNAACKVVEDNANSMRVALYSFTAGPDNTRGNLDDGAELDVDFGADIPTLKAGINALTAYQYTPLGSSMRSIVQNYMSSSGPIQYRCQKNYIVFFTDGEPTSGIDETNSGGSSNTTFSLPSVDSSAQQKSPWRNSVATTGASTVGSPNWDGFPDVQNYADSVWAFPWADDLSQFAYDIDIKKSDSSTSAATCGSSTAPAAGKDCAGKSWDGSDDPDEDGQPVGTKEFAQQRVITYTVGLGDSGLNEMMMDAALVNRVAITPTEVDDVNDTLTIPEHGLSTGAFVHYYSSYTVTPESLTALTADVNTGSDSIQADTSKMSTGTQLTYDNAGGASLSYDETTITTTGYTLDFNGWDWSTSNDRVQRSHSFNTGDAMVYDCGSGCASTSPSSLLTNGNTYYAIRQSGSRLRVATSSTNASSNIYINITGGGGSNQSFTRPEVSTTTTGNTSSSYYAAVTTSGSPGAFKLASSSANAYLCAAGDNTKCIDISAAGNDAQTFSWSGTTSDATIPGLYPYETDARADDTPTPSTESAARGKYFVTKVDEDTIKLSECGLVAGCISPAATTVDITGKGYGWLSTGPGKYYHVTDVDTLSASLTSAFTEISNQDLNFSSISTNSTELRTSTRIYQARFNTGDWSGDAVSLVIQGGIVDETNPEWKASDKLIPFVANDSRNIWTWNGSAAVEFKPANFGSLSNAQQRSLTNGVITNTTLGQDVMTWVRGDNTLGGSFRERKNGALGDIIDSQLTYVGQPSENYDADLPTGAEATAYGTFKSSTTRVPMLYGGSNGGKVHGFNVDTAGNAGDEEFAFIPEGVYVDWADQNDDAVLNGTETESFKFYELSRKYYGLTPTQPHLYFVNGSPASGDAYFGGAWHTMLVGGLRKGGRSVYALDITDPTNFGAADVKWEFSDGGTMGYSFSAPQIVRLQDGRWVAVFGNGYDSAGDGASVYVVNMADGTLIQEIALTSSLANGVSSVAVLRDKNDIDGDKDKVEALAIYAADLQGNVWKIDVSTGVPSAVGTPFFVAEDDGGNRQPITAPIVVEHYDTIPGSGTYKAMVFVGTGKYFAAEDLAYDYPTTGPEWDGMYGLYDNGIATSVLTDKTTLVEQKIGSVSGTSNLTLTSNTVDYAGGDQGWYIKLAETATSVVGSPYKGEKVIFSPGIVNKVLYFSTVIPPDIDPCISGGSSSVFLVDALSGGAYTSAVFDTNGDGVINGSDDSSVAGFKTDDITTGVLIFKEDTDGDGISDTDQLCLGKNNQKVECQPIDVTDDPAAAPGLSSGRMGWRQLQ